MRKSNFNLKYLKNQKLYPEFVFKLENEEVYLHKNMKIEDMRFKIFLKKIFFERPVITTVVLKSRNSVTESGNSLYGKRKAKRRKFRTKSRKMVKISVKVPKTRNFFF